MAEQTQTSEITTTNQDTNTNLIANIGNTLDKSNCEP